MNRRAALLCGVLASVWLASRAHALLGERSLLLGRTLAALASAGTETKLELNGQRLSLASLSLRAGSSEVVRRFAAACASGPHSLVLHRELAARAGAALCLADWRSAELRFLYVSSDARGLSHALLATSEGEIELRGMFPAHGDAAGSDLPDLPRPTDSR
ncbi:MAG TPA: hypothetical protein VJR89_25245, partial [Polyangiales bacterium]|nr:hypothetical protein [Polyangiales bacterium]